MRIVVLYCGERHKGGDDRQPRAIDGVQTGSTAPRTASPNSRITRRYIYLIRVPGVDGVPPGSAEYYTSYYFCWCRGGCRARAFFFPRRYDPIVTRRSGPFSRPLGRTRYFSQSVERETIHMGDPSDLFRLGQTRPADVEHPWKRGPKFTTESVDRCRASSI